MRKFATGGAIIPLLLFFLATARQRVFRSARMTLPLAVGSDSLQIVKPIPFGFVVTYGF